MNLFHSFGATNKPGTCRWCGRKLRSPVHIPKDRAKSRRGDYGDDTFCGLRCGYQFGLALSKERVLKPTKEQEND